MRLRKEYKAEYAAYRNAKYRCETPRSKDYFRYGGRGIQFRLPTFEQFLTHIGPRPAGMTLDRINNDGHYELGNVRWATPVTQSNNQRLNSLLKPRPRVNIVSVQLVGWHCLNCGYKWYSPNSLQCRKCHKLAHYRPGDKPGRPTHEELRKLST